MQNAIAMKLVVERCSAQLKEIEERLEQMERGKFRVLRVGSNAVQNDITSECIAEDRQLVILLNQIISENP